MSNQKRNALGRGLAALIPGAPSPAPAAPVTPVRRPEGDGVRTIAIEDVHPAPGQPRTIFDDARLEELVFRWRARNFPATLADDERARWKEHLRARLVDGAGGATSLQAFFDRIDALAEDADERAQALLGALYDHGEALAAQLD